MRKVYFYITRKKCPLIGGFTNEYAISGSDRADSIKIITKNN